VPIFVHLDRLLFERELSLTGLSQRVDLTLANLSILKTGKARAIRFSTLEAICRELECQPGELLEYVAASEVANPQERPGQPSGRAGPGQPAEVPAPDR
jgi:putative transcriptional regulator